MKTASDTHSRDKLEALFKTGKLVRYTKRQLIFHADDAPQAVYYIHDGFVKVYSLNDRGEEYIHLIYGKGEVFPVTLFAGRMKSNIYYVALSNCTLYRMEPERLQRMMKTDASTAYTVLEQLCAQFRIYSDRIDNLEYKYARERLAYRMLFLAGRFGHRRETGAYILDAPLTQKLIADTINLSRESVSREFERLQTKGVVTYEDRNIILKNVDGLLKELPDALTLEDFGLTA